jgi:uncharacterized cupin superfamily protein
LQQGTDQTESRQGLRKRRSIPLQPLNSKESNMVKMGNNFKVSSIGEISKIGRVTLHNEIGMTGSEVSINNLPAGVSVPFVHAHKQNEELYIILKGKGQFYIDGEEFAVVEGDALRLDLAAVRCVKADANSSLSYVCIQTQTGSLKVSLKPTACRWRPSLAGCKLSAF